MLTRTDSATTLDGVEGSTRGILSRVVLALTACALFAALPASAVHNADEHSANIRQVANVPGSGAILPSGRTPRVLTDGYLDRDAGNEGSSCSISRARGNSHVRKEVVARVQL